MDASLMNCIETLEEQAKPTTNDIRFHQYVEYINAFLQHFGDERIFLVGSTGDGTKLSVPTDQGDADYLIITDRMKVPVEAIEFRLESTSYCWIRANDISLKVGQEFMDNGYLKAEFLHELHPKLFSIARGIYIHLSANIDRVRGANKEETSLGIRSKVGLAHTTYRDIEIHGNLHRYRHIVNNASKHGGHVTLPKLDEEDSKIAGRFIELLNMAKRPGKQDEFRGEFTFFVDLLEEALHTQPTNTTMASELNDVDDERPKALEDDTKACHIQNAFMVGDAGRNTRGICASQMKTVSNKQQDLRPCAPLKKPQHEASDYQQHDEDKTEDGEEDIILQFKKTTNKDFVPAIKIAGKLECMDRWKKRVTELAWAKEKIDDIHGTDMYLIAREAIVSPNPTLDFCLAFSLQEQKLVKGFSKDQKLVYLILKTLRKGCFDYTFELRKIPLKLRTYHMKTVALWTFENGYLSNERDMAEPEIILRATNEAVAFLAKAVNRKLLRHYFTEDNLLGNFDDADFEIISQVCDGIQSVTKTEIKTSLERSEVTSNKKHLTRDEINLLVQLEGDGGRQNSIDRVREGLADIIRGIISAKEDRQGNQSALKLAILNVSRLIFQDCSTKMSTNKITGTAQGKTLGFGEIFKAVQTIIRKDKGHSQDKINVAINCADILCNMNPKVKRAVEKIGGTESLRSVLLGAANVDTDHGARDIECIMKLIEQFLTVRDESKDKIAAELKVNWPSFSCRADFYKMQHELN